MREVSLIGTGVTHFGKDDRDILQLLAAAALDAIKDSRTEKEQFGSIFVANMGSGEFEGKSGIGNALVSDMALEPAFATKVENTSGSGGTALYLGWLSVASGQSDLTLVVGGEKMTTVSTGVATDIIASLPGMRERTITIQSCTKSYAMPAWRIGYMVAPPNITEQLLKLLEWMVLCSSYVGQKAALPRSPARRIGSTTYRSISNAEGTKSTLGSAQSRVSLL